MWIRTYAAAATAVRVRTTSSAVFPGGPSGGSGASVMRLLRAGDGASAERARSFGWFPDRARSAFFRPGRDDHRQKWAAAGVHWPKPVATMLATTRQM